MEHDWPRLGLKIHLTRPLRFTSISKVLASGTVDVAGSHRLLPILDDLDDQTGESG